ncbi:MAG: vitamin B12 transporter [Oceanicoccus sp.]|jgi:vitamin B12 transporter
MLFQLTTRNSLLTKRSRTPLFSAMSGLVFSLTASLATSSTHPNAEAATHNKDLETMIVTGSREPIRLRDSTSSITVINNETLARKSPLILSDILRGIPGLAVSQSGGLGAITQIRMRGAEGNHVLVMIDGIPANDLGQGDEFNFGHLLASDIDQVEVLRGPQSSLWGSGALAGVISVKTKRSMPGFHTDGHVDYGTNNTVNTGIGFGGGDDRFNYRISGSYLDSDGENFSQAGDEDDAYTNKTFNGNASFQATDTLKFSAVLRRTETDAEFDDISFVTGLPEDADKLTEATQSFALLKANKSTFEDRWNHEIGVSYAKTDNETFTNQSWDNSNEGKRERYYLQSSWTPNDNDTVTIVIEDVKETFQQRGVVSFFGDPNRNLNNSITSYVAEYRHSWDNGFKISLSSRYDDNETFDSSTSFRSGLVYDRLQDGWQVKASVARGAKNPSFSERFGFYETSLYPFVGNPDLKPEESDSYELAVILRPQDSALQFEFVYFNEQLNDEINGFYYDPSLLATTAVNTDGKSKRSGIEASTQWLVSEDVNVYFSYTYTDSKDANDVREIRRPMHLANLDIDYSFNSRSQLSVNVNYNGQQDDLFFGPPSYAGETVSLDSYTLLSLLIKHKLSSSMDVYGRIENALGENHEDVYGFESRGSNASVGLRLAF